MKWFHGRTSGVFGAGQNCAVAPAQNAMAVTVSDGLGWMANDTGDGIVWWNDYAKEHNGENLKLEISIAPAITGQTRIDRIVVTWQTTNYVALPTISVLEGTAAQVPVPPTLTNSNTQRQISLAKITIPAGITTLSAANITDERLDSTVCGLVNETITVDTSMVQSQMEALLAAIQSELEDIHAGTEYEIKKYQFTNVAVPLTAFVEQQSPTHDDYPYRALVQPAGITITGSEVPEVIFSVEQVAQGVFAATAETTSGGIYIYAADVPEPDTDGGNSITIPVIICWRS